MTSRKLDLSIPNVPYPTPARGLVLGYNGKLPSRVLEPGGPPGPEGPPGPVGPTGGQFYSQVIGDGATTIFTVTHNFGVREVVVTVYRNVAPYDEVEADVEHTDVNAITVRTLKTPSLNEFVVAVSAPGNGPGGPPGPVGPIGPPGGQFYSQTIGDGATTVFTVPHNFGAREVVVTVFRNVAPYDEVEADVEHTTANAVTVRTPRAPSSGEFVVAVSAPGTAPNSDLNYVHTQGTPSAVWSVVHNLGKYVCIEVVDSGDSVVLPDIHYDSVNAITLTFGSPTSGKAFVN